MIDTVSPSDGYDELNSSNDRVTTSEARDRLEDTIFSTLESAENTLIDAPTSLGKSFTVATTPWLKYPEVTGSSLVIHVHQTTEARDEAVEESKEAGLSYAVFKGREDTCPTAAGIHDDTITAPHGLTPSEWFEWMCDVRNVPFSDAHAKLQSHCDIPCESNSRCPFFTQWQQRLRASGQPAVDVVHTTADFAHLEELSEGPNLVFDERPEYALTLGDTERQQIRDALSNLLDYRSNGKRAMCDVQTANLREKPELEAELRDLLDEEIDTDWYFRREETHRLAPEIGLAMLNADEVIDNRWAGEEVDFSGRRMGEHGRVKVVMDSKGKLRHVHYRPDFTEARCVIGLDAFPSAYRWRLNTVDDLARVDVLPPEERHYWRREERGLKVIQVGDATRSYTQGWDGAGEERAAELIRELREKHGDKFRTCITAGSIEDDVREFMRDAGIASPRTMHYGEQNSRNDFTDEVIGLTLACIDPGDKNILDLLALGGRCAQPRIMTTEEGDKERKTGRSFVGPDADIAGEILSSVRGANIAQAAGRYARDPESPESSATVYVWSDACPDSLVDEKITVSYHSLTNTRRNIIRLLRDGCETKREIEDVTGGNESYLIECLETFHDAGLVDKTEGAGKYGATEWKWDGEDWFRQDPEAIVQLNA